MTHLQTYVPRNTEDELLHPVTNETFKVNIDNFNHIVFGVYQLTVERAIGGKKERCNESRGLERLDGLIPIIEDWQSKVALL